MVRRWISLPLLALVSSCLGSTFAPGRLYFWTSQTPVVPGAQVSCGDVPAFRTTSSLVQVHVIVTGKRGPVLDLNVEDFALLDRGKPRKIATFLAPETAVAEQSLLPSPLNTFSNSLGFEQTRTLRATVILLDCLNTSFQSQSFARRQVMKWLRQVDSHQRIALYFLGKSLHIAHDFASDPKELITFIEQLQGLHSSDEAFSDPSKQPKTGIPAFDAIMEHLNGVLADHARTNRGLATLGSMEAIATHLSSVPGRKNLVWVSSGFPFSIGTTDPGVWASRLAGRDREMRTFREQIERVARLYNDANIAIYPVDAGGLAMDSIFREASRDQASRELPLAVPVTDTIRSAHETMEELATSTGGRAFYNSNDISGAIEQAVSDAEATYSLGFYPTTSDLDSQFHKLEVRVRRDGLRLRFRKGYVAYSDSPTTDARRDLNLRSALTSPLQMTGIDVVFRADPIDAAQRDVLRIQITANARQVVFARRGEKMTGAVEVLLTQQDSVGSVLDHYRNRVNMEFTPDELTVALQKGLIMRKTIRLQTKAATIRAIIQDSASGAVGSVIVPVSRLERYRTRHLP